MRLYSTYEIVRAIEPASAGNFQESQKLPGILQAAKILRSAEVAKRVECVQLAGAV